MKFIIIAIILIFSANDVDAGCKIWSVEDSSVPGQSRESVFVSSDLTDHDKVVALGVGVASRRAIENSLDFIDVFVTRARDSEIRSEHSAMSSMAQVRFNPGGTPITDRIITAQAIRQYNGLEMVYQMLMLDGGSVLAKKSDLTRAEINSIVELQRDIFQMRCDED